ncbi:MAG: thiamine pyrophosphate-dependent dehydrogenase E1 component subunit alpha [bacterium]|nr:thiamine pyrophosphate-dependent dehydrogenase E1 component subunit alpha [bacterium]
MIKKNKKKPMKPDLKQLFLSMTRLRMFEERVADLLLKDEIKCPTHLYIGQEAVAVGVCEALKKDDYVFSTHRSHGHYLAKGGDMKKLMAELFGKSTGCSQGRGGSMHIAAPDIGYLGSTAIVGADIPIGVGAGLSSCVRKSKQISVIFFGDGAVDEGVFYESINYASLYKLPVLFICENNLFSTHLRICFRQPADNIFQRIKTFKMPSKRIDGNDVLEVYKNTCAAVDHIRQGKGPYFLECRTYRWRAHVGPWLDIDFDFRSKAEVESWIRKCPIKKLEKAMLKKKDFSAAERDRIIADVKNEIDEAYRFSQESPYPDAKELLNHVFRD